MPRYSPSSIGIRYLKNYRHLPESTLSSAAFFLWEEDNKGQYL